MYKLFVRNILYFGTLQLVLSPETAVVIWNLLYLKIRLCKLKL